MRRKVLLVMLIFSFSLVYAQNTIVKYVDFRADIPGQSESHEEFLIFNQDSAISIPVYHKMFDSFQDLLNDKDFVTNPLYRRSFRKENIDSNVYTAVSSIPDKGTVLYRDSIEYPRWKLSSSNEKVLGYATELATGRFRGRDYQIWFTPEIPAPVGPWKLGGLPGLILKVVIDKGAFTFSAERIIGNANLGAPKKFYDFYGKYKTAIHPYPLVVKAENAAYEQIKKEAIASLPSKEHLIPSNHPIRENFLEITFEWDKTPSEKSKVDYSKVVIIKSN